MLKVADLQRFIDGLAQPLKNAGASPKVLDDLARMSQGLERFSDRTIDEFNDFLQTAQNYIADGTLPEPGRRASSRSRSGGTGAPKLSVEEAAQSILALQERAGSDPNLDFTVIEGELRGLEPLTVGQLKQVAEQVHMSEPLRGRTKEDLLKALATAIKDRKWGSERTLNLQTGGGTQAQPTGGHHPTGGQQPRPGEQRPDRREEVRSGTEHEATAGRHTGSP